MSTRDVETAFTQGYVLVLLIEDCINSFTRDVLEAKTTIIAEKKMVEYNKNMLTVHPDFKVLLCNKSLSPDLEPELYTQYNVINFQITETMLKLKLLAEVINL